MVVSIVLKEKGRNRLGVLTAILSAVLALAGFCIIFVGLYIQLHITDQLILLESYGSGVLPHFIVSVGVIMFLINGATVKFAYDSGFAETSEKFRLVLIPVLIVMFLFIWVILAAAIMTLSMRGDVEDALHAGLKGAMKRYKKNLPVKVTIDKMQMVMRCCGSRSYKDWFEVGWINTEYVDTQDVDVKSKMRDGDLFTDDVPFSCCDIKSARPCVSHSVNSKSKHNNYEKMTLYSKGCTDTIMDEFENRILKPAGSVVMLLFGAQVFVMILLRYLQTSVQGAFEDGDMEGPGRGFLFPAMCTSCTSGNPDKYKDGALKAIRGEGGDNSTVGDTTQDSSLLPDGLDLLMDDKGGGGGGDKSKKLEITSNVGHDFEESMMSEIQRSEDLNADDITLENASFSSLTDLESGTNLLNDSINKTPSFNPNNSLQHSYIHEDNLHDLNVLRTTHDSIHRQNRNNKDEKGSNMKITTDIGGFVSEQYDKRDRLDKHHSLNSSKMSHQTEKSPKKSLFQSARESQSPKKSKTPKTANSSSPSPKESRSPKKSKTSKTEKSSKKSRSPSPKEPRSPKKSKTSKTAKSSKKSRSQSPKESRSPEKSKTSKTAKSSKKSRSQSPKESRSPKKSKTSKTAKSSKRPRSQSPEESRSPEKSKTSKTAKSSKRSRSQSPEESRSPKKSKTSKTTKSSKMSRSQSPKESRSPKKSKTSKTAKSSKKSRTQSPKESRSPKKSKTSKTAKSSKKSRSQSPKEPRFPKKSKTSKTAKSSKKSMSPSPKESPSHKKSKQLKTANSSKRFRSPSPKKSRSPKKSKTKRSKPVKKSRSPAKSKPPKKGSKTPKR